MKFQDPRHSLDNFSQWPVSLSDAIRIMASMGTPATERDLWEIVGIIIDTLPDAQQQAIADKLAIRNLP